MGKCSERAAGDTRSFSKPAARNKHVSLCALIASAGKELFFSYPYSMSLTSPECVDEGVALFIGDGGRHRNQSKQVCRSTERAQEQMIVQHPELT